jgi:hypothetical protein
MDLAVALVIAISALAGTVVVLWLFVWAARKDGEHDDAVQARLGTKRRTWLGR